MPNEVEVSPIFSTTLTINVRVFLCSIFNGRARSEAISRPKGVALYALVEQPVCCAHNNYNEIYYIYPK
jgi:hypothetical protein